MNADELNARTVALTDALRRSGAISVQWRYQDDQPPTVWICVASFPGMPSLHHVNVRSDAAAGMWPWVAGERLLDQLADGTPCPRCGGITQVRHRIDDAELPLPGLCTFDFDPSTKRYVRACREAPDAGVGGPR